MSRLRELLFDVYAAFYWLRLGENDASARRFRSVVFVCGLELIAGVVSVAWFVILRYGPPASYPDISKPHFYLGGLAWILVNHFAVFRLDAWTRYQDRFRALPLGAQRRRLHSAWSMVALAVAYIAVSTFVIAFFGLIRQVPKH